MIVKVSERSTVLDFAWALLLVLLSAFLMAVALLLFLPFRLLKALLRLRWGLLIPAGLLAGAVGWGLYQDRPTGAGPALVEVPPGASASRIARMLEDRGLVRSARLFRLLAELSRDDLKAGTYELDGRWPAHRILQKLRRGRPYTVKVTIPEGLTLRQIAGVLRRKVQVDSAAFVALAADSAFARSLGVPAPTLEGYLFPDTYLLPWRPSPDAVLRTMVEGFRRAFPDTLWERAGALGLSPHQVVILASIVEKEAMVDWERPLIASVFLRRLKLGYPLQSCSTVLYAMGRHKTHLTERDLHFPSPYNTYLHRGLPPGPISNPGRASVLAVLYPAKEEYLYFVSKGDGTHIFSKSYREHLRAKRMVRRKG